jgi:hypothetical protein
MNHSSALVYSTQLRVSVYGTGSCNLELRGFSWLLLRFYPVARRLPVLSGSNLSADLPTNINFYTLKRTIPSVRKAFSATSPLRSYSR